MSVKHIGYGHFELRDRDGRVRSEVALPNDVFPFEIETAISWLVNGSTTWQLYWGADCFLLGAAQGNLNQDIIERKAHFSQYDDTNLTSYSSSPWFWYQNYRCGNSKNVLAPAPPSDISFAVGRVYCGSKQPTPNRIMSASDVKLQGNYLGNVFGHPAGRGAFFNETAIAPTGTGQFSPIGPVVFPTEADKFHWIVDLRITDSGDKDSAQYILRKRGYYQKNGGSDPFYCMNTSNPDSISLQDARPRRDGDSNANWTGCKFGENTAPDANQCSSGFAYDPVTNFYYWVTVPNTGYAAANYRQCFRWLRLGGLVTEKVDGNFKARMTGWPTDYGASTLFSTIASGRGWGGKGRVYVGVHDQNDGSNSGGLLKLNTSDGTCTRIQAPFGRNVRGIVVDTTGKNTAGGVDRVFLFHDNGISYSDDDGATWMAIGDTASAAMHPVIAVGSDRLRWKYSSPSTIQDSQSQFDGHDLCDFDSDGNIYWISTPQSTSYKFRVNKLTWNGSAWVHSFITLGTVAEAGATGFIKLGQAYDAAATGELTGYTSAYSASSMRVHRRHYADPDPDQLWLGANYCDDAPNDMWGAAINLPTFDASTCEQYSVSSTTLNSRPAQPLSNWWGTGPGYTGSPNYNSRIYRHITNILIFDGGTIQVVEASSYGSTNRMYFRGSGWTTFGHYNYQPFNGVGNTYWMQIGGAVIPDPVMGGMLLMPTSDYFSNIFGGFQIGHWIDYAWSDTYQLWYPKRQSVVSATGAFGKKSMGNANKDLIYGMKASFVNGAGPLQFVAGENYTWAVSPGFVKDNTQEVTFGYDMYRQKTVLTTYPFLDQASIRTAKNYQDCATGAKAGFKAGGLGTVLTDEPVDTNPVNFFSHNLRNLASWTGGSSETNIGTWAMNQNVGGQWAIDLKSDRRCDRLEVGWGGGYSTDYSQYLRVRVYRKKLGEGSYTLVGTEMPASLSDDSWLSLEMDPGKQWTNFNNSIWVWGSPMVFHVDLSTLLPQVSDRTAYRWKVVVDLFGGGANLSSMPQPAGISAFGQNNELLGRLENLCGAPQTVDENLNHIGTTIYQWSWIQDSAVADATKTLTGVAGDNKFTLSGGGTFAADIVDGDYMRVSPTKQYKIKSRDSATQVTIYGVIDVGGHVVIDWEIGRAAGYTHGIPGAGSIGCDPITGTLTHWPADVGRRFRIEKSVSVLRT